jgi:hypothetical protein
MGEADHGAGKRRTRTLKVVVSQAEAAQIAVCAQAADLSVSAYLRRLGLGYELASKLDRQLILELIRLNGDQGRLGGLLKLWLSERPGEGASAFDVRQLLRQIERVQERLKAAIRRL